MADALKSLKQEVARRLLGDAEQFWQKQYYDFNIRDYQFMDEAALHSSKSGQARIVRVSGGLGVEQLSSLRDWH